MDKPFGEMKCAHGIPIGWSCIVCLGIIRAIGRGDSVLRANGHAVELPMDTPKFGHAPIPMRHRIHEDRFERVGDFYWQLVEGGKRLLWVAIPCKRNSRLVQTNGELGWVLSEWTIDHKNHCGAQWAWNGDHDRPTLTPSLHAVGVWHGKVTNGELVEA